MNVLITIAATAVTFFALGCILTANVMTAKQSNLYRRMHKRSQHVMSENADLRQQLGTDREDVL